MSRLRMLFPVFLLLVTGCGFDPALVKKHFRKSGKIILLVDDFSGFVFNNQASVMLEMPKAFTDLAFDMHTLMKNTFPDCQILIVTNRIGSGKILVPDNKAADVFFHIKFNGTYSTYPNLSGKRKMGSLTLYSYLLFYNNKKEKIGNGAKYLMAESQKEKKYPSDIHDIMELIAPLDLIDDFKDDFLMRMKRFIKKLKQ